MREALPAGWRFTRLDELGTVERGRSRHRPRNDPALYGGRYPFVQTGDIKAAGLRLFDFSQTYSEIGLSQSRLWPPGTLCITIAANICDTAILGIPACFPDSIVGFTAAPSVADAVFVKYALDQAKRRFADISRGATQDNLSLEKLLSQKLPIPPLDKQRRIASILGAYDDLIEVNRRRIAVLEEMARRLFEEWFVHFRFPGHSPEVVEPESLPADWKRVKLAEVATINGATLRPADAPARIGYVDIASVSPGTIETVQWMSFQAAPGRARRRVRDGSIIWSMVRPNRRSFALVLDPEPDTIVSTGFAVIDAEEIPTAYLYHWVTQDAFVGYLSANATGAAYPAVTAAVFERAEVTVPPADLMRRFSVLCDPQLRLAAKLRASNSALANSRDVLLPRLISGDLPITAAERELEAVA